MKYRGEKSRHIIIYYFFMKDVIQQEGIELMHFITDKTVVGYYIKTLQGKVFKSMRDYIIMGTNMILIGVY